MPSEVSGGNVIHLPPRAGALIFVEGGQLLFSQKIHRKGVQIPKGTNEKGEDLVQTMIRESYEEAGVEIEEPLQYLGHYEIRKVQRESRDIFMKTVHIYICTPMVLQDTYEPQETEKYKTAVKVPFDLECLKKRMHHREEYDFLNENASAIQWYAESFHGLYDDCLAEACDS